MYYYIVIIVVLFYRCLKIPLFWLFLGPWVNACFGPVLGFLKSPLFLAIFFSIFIMFYFLIIYYLLNYNYLFVLFIKFIGFVHFWLFLGPWVNACFWTCFWGSFLDLFFDIFLLFFIYFYLFIIINCDKINFKIIFKKWSFLGSRPGVRILAIFGPFLAIFGPSPKSRFLASHITPYLKSNFCFFPTELHIT